MKSILVTGCAGFIGYHSAAMMKRRGDFVVGIDSFSKGASFLLKKERQKLLEDLDIPIFPADICDTQIVKKYIEKYKITHVLHLAAQAGVRESFNNPDPYVHANLRGFVSILEAIKERPDIRLVYASSSSVYGHNKTFPFSEEHPVENPANLYAATKRCAEVLAASYHHLYKLSLCGLRYFTVYGPWGRPDMAYFHFAQSILEEKPITLHAMGKMERDFTYIDDIVMGTLQALDQDSALAKRDEGSFSLYNLGSSRPVSVEYLVLLLEKSLNKKAMIQFQADAKGETQKTYANIAKAQSELGYRPKVSFEEGILRFTNWMKAFKKQSIPTFSVRDN